MMRAVLSAAVLLVLTVAAQAERRVALVLAVDQYRTIRPLKNAVADGEAVAQALKALGFAVTVESDRDLRRTRRALEDFREDGVGADVALVYYAGHGVEISGDNRLLPVDADAQSLEALKATSLPLEEVRDTVAAVAKVGLIVLDACRNDPFGSAGGEGRSAVALHPNVAAAVTPGLGRMGRAENILFAFSAAPGETASDGADGHSPFAAALAKYLPAEGLEIRSVLTLVQQEVYDFSRGRQLPYVESGLPAMFFAAAAADKLPERERLLLAMADIKPDIRAEVEKIAADNAMPLAPLYGALLAADLKDAPRADRGRKLAEAASAYVETQGRLKTLAASDPAVARLRQAAEESLSLGAFAEARASLAQAAAIDADSSEALAQNLVGRRLSQAATHAADAGVAKAQLDYRAAIAALEKAAALHEMVENEAVADADRRERDWLLADLGDTLVLVGDTDAALDAYRRMQAAAELRLARAPGEPDAERDLSVSRNKIGDVELARGDLAGALAAYQAGLDIRERLASSDPGNAGRQRDLSASRNKIGDVKKAQGDLAGALSAYRAGLDIAERLASSDPGNAGRQRDLSIGHDRIGDVRAAQGDLAGALAAYQESLSIRERLAQADPGNAGRQRDLALSQDRIGDIRIAQGDPAGGLAAYQASLSVRERLAASDPGNAGWQRDVAVSDQRIGDVKAEQGDQAGALAAYEAALAVVERLAASDPGNAGWQRDLALNRERVGDTKLAQGDRDGALAAYQASLSIREQLARSDPGNAGWQHDLSVGQERIGDLKLAQGDRDGALAAYQASLSIREKLARASPDNAGWQRDLILSHSRVAQAGGDQRQHLQAALEVAEAMQRRGMLAPSDASIPDILRDALAKLDVAQK